jgi:PAS domain S-box-containing protein
MPDDIRVLHVDDDPDMTALTGEFLERNSDRLSVVAETSATDALDRITEGNVDCVVADYDMPAMNGLELLERVRERYPNLPYILFTGKGSEEIASDAISAGVSDYLQKGFGAEQYELLANRITNAVDQRRAQGKVETIRRRFGKLVRYATDVISVLDTDGTIRYLTPSVERILGYEPQELIGEKAVEYVHPDDRQRVIEIFPGDGDDSDAVPTVEFRLRGRDGSWIDAEGQVRNLLADPDVEGVVWYVRDVSNRQSLERELKEKSNLLDEIFASVPTHLYVKDEQARNVRVGAYYVDNPEEHIGKTDLEIYDDEFSRETYDDDMRVIETGEPIVNKEEYIPHRDDWNLTSKVPWRDEDGEIKGLIGVSRRITKRKEYEQQLERQNERLEKFASVVAHDLRNPLNAAAGYLDLVAEECDSDYVERVDRSLDRMDTITDDVLTMAREGQSVERLGPVGLERVARDCWTTSDTPDAELEVASDLVFEAERDRLRVVFENLFQNAVRHGGADVTVRVGAIDGGEGRDASDDRDGDGAPDADGVDRRADGAVPYSEARGCGFFVEDDGRGIPEDVREEVFSPGYSTASSGTGFGLNIVQELVEAHGWEIAVTESAAGGARFEITGVEPIDD